jgi:hypothetical protein
VTITRLDCTVDCGVEVEGTCNSVQINRDFELSRKVSVRKIRKGHQDLDKSKKQAIFRKKKQNQYHHTVN